MSLDVKQIVQFPQEGLDFPAHSDNLLGGVLHDTRYVWQAKGSVLEIRNTKTGSKVGAWVFGGILKDSNTRIVCVEEIHRTNGRISLLAVGTECTISGGIICIFDIFSSKVIRAIHVKEKISSMHVIDSGIEDLNLPGPLRNFDGILAVGTHGGEVILIDICRQICVESFHSISKKDELNPSQLTLLTIRHIQKIEPYKQRSVQEGCHLAIHLNAVFDSTTEHFVLKGPKGEDQMHVNKEEVVISALYYCPQLASLLVGYNFGAFQLWNLTTLKLVYTSPICEEHLPITNFGLQEPTDDPRAFCYIWVTYSNTELYQTGLPFAVMYSLCYETKEYQEGYGYLYQDFHYCTVRFQIELGQLEEHRNGNSPKGGYCLGVQPITKLSMNKESFSRSPGDTLAVCMVSWTIWYSKSDTQTYCMVFDLNQWYKEQMPSFTKWKDSTNYILRAALSELIYLNGHKGAPISNVFLEDKSLSQFVGIQRLEEHFYPSSLSFNLWILRINDVVLMHNQSLQKHLLSQIESAGPLCLLRPTDVCRQAITIGVMPLFSEVNPNRSLTIETQREIILDVALEHQLISWLCKCASEWANGSFSSAGCSLDFLLNWAFHRAIVLKTNCDKYCVPLFDYSQMRLDNNTSILLNSCTRQINSLCVLYKHIIRKLSSFVNGLDLIKECCTRLEMVSVYFEVLQWLVNVGLLPECHPSTYPRPDNSERISAPYPAQELMEYYNEKRAELRLLSKETFNSNDSLLFIDNLIDRKCGGGRLQKQWQEDGGSGLYPPPSLQSLIRAYLIDGAGNSHKHSLVIYLFLDLAMALDQSRYSSVVTHLIKFPAVFKVSPSIIKITQAFWQLDHGDFTTAMKQLLDPFVLGEDLQPWHHTIAMRSLLINKQPNFALLYMQIRKPPITDENDVMTAISLFVANNMIDEAFYFKKQHQNNNRDKLLAHLFHECSKNNTLHSVLYKCLDTDEEKSFFDFLSDVDNPNLQIFYYLLRSRFIEAFDAHSNIKRKGPTRQGLIGQSMATSTDQIVQIFKSLLPDVSKKLVEYVRKERNNLWKEVQRPTPMSVFVHDTNEQIKYKSTLMHAALAKAKHTFPDALNQSRNIITEETPFLRTPTMYRNGKRAITPIITPKIIDNNESMDELSDPPNKRMKISSRTAATSTPSPLKNASMSITMTPMVKRKVSLHDLSGSLSNINICTPQSILKVRNIVRQRDSIRNELPVNEEYGLKIHGNSSVCDPPVDQQSRDSLSRSLKRQHVQFDEATRFSLSLSDLSAKLLDATPPENQVSLKSSLSSKDISTMLSSTTSEEASDVFYSPDNSGSLLETKEGPEDEQLKEQENAGEAETKENEEICSNKTDIEEGNDVASVSSPRARRSYKRSLVETSPTRSSPRLSKLHTVAKEDSSIEKSITEDSMSTDSLSPKPTRVVSKVKGRKSLSRQVLENNTFSKIRTPQQENSIYKESSLFKSQTITINERSLDESKVTTVESNLKIVDTEKEDSSPIVHKTHTSTSSYKKEEYLQKTVDSDTSVDTDSSFYLHKEEGEQDMKLSDSLQEYMDFLMASEKKIHKVDKAVLSKVHLDFVEENDTENVTVNKETDQLWTVREEDTKEDEDKQQVLDRSSKEAVQGDEEVEDTSAAGTLLNPIETEELPVTIESTSAPVEHPPVELSKAVEVSTETNSISGEINDDTPSESDDNELEESYNELEMNIFGFDETGFSKTRRSDAFGDSITSDNYKLPESELAFVVDDCEKQPDSLVVISSSDDGDNVDDKPSSNSGSEKHRSNWSECTEPLDYNEHDDMAFQNEEQEIEDNVNGGNSYIVEEPPENVPETILQQQNPLDVEEVGAKDVSELMNRSLEDIVKIALSEDKNNEKHEVVIEITEITEDLPVSTTVPLEIVDDMTTEPIETLVENKDEGIDVDESAHPVIEEIEQIEESTHRVIEEIQEIEESTHSRDVELKEQVELIENTIDGGNVTSNKTPTLDQLIHPSNQTIKDDTEPKQTDAVEEIEIKLSKKKTDQSTNTTLKKKGKIEQSTNTTVVAKGRSSKRKEKVDQSTNTSVIAKTKNIAGKKSAEKIDEGDDIKNDETPSEQETEHVIMEDNRQIDDTTSDQIHSSYTTEGETLGIDAALVEIHANANKTEESSKRITRSSIVDIDIKSTTSNSDETKNLIVQIEKSDISLCLQQPKLAKRNRRAYSSSDVPDQTTPTNKPDVRIDCDPNTSTEIIDDAAVVTLTMRKKRSASVDAVKTFSRQSASKKSKEADRHVAENAKERRTKSVIQMPVISEEKINEGKKTDSRKARSVAEDYKMSRRLTRRQASMVKDVTITTDVESLEELRKAQSIDLELIDPINLLDKETFEGKADPDEKKVYEPSSPSSSTTTSVHRNMRSRSASVLSELSISPPQDPSTPKKSSGRRTRNQNKSPTASGVSTRSRKQSETSSVVSEHSETSAPRKRSRSKKSEEDIETTTIGTRSRTVSISSVKSAESTTRKIARAKRAVSAKSDLPEITEEKILEKDDTASSSNSKNGKSKEKNRRKK